MTSQLLMSGGVVVLLIKVTLLLTLSLVWAGALARASASTRHLLWLTCLSLLLALPLLSSTTPELRIVPLPFGSAELAPLPAAEAASELAPPAEGVSLDEPVAAFRADATVAPPAAGPAWKLDASVVLTLLLAIWGAGSLLLLGRLALSAVALRRALRRTTPLEGSEWSVPLCEAADRLDLDDIPRLVLSEDAPMPFACGFRKPTIVLPAVAMEWDASRRRAVLFHELAHIRRRDLAGHTVARLVCALYWIHPMVWTAARRLRAESERACDDLALSVGIRASEYADHLLQIVTAVRGKHSPAVALPFADRRELEGRVLAILDPVLRRGRPSGANVGALAALVLCGVAFSAVAPAVDSRAAAADDAWQADGSALSSPPAASSAPSAPSAPGAEGPAPAGLEEHLTIEERIDGALDAHVELVVSATDSDGARITISQGGETADLSLLLAALADDPSPIVRKTAAWSLARADAPIAAAALSRALLGDGDAGVRETAAWALEADQTRAGTDALLQALARDPSDQVRATAAWALGSSSRPPAMVLPALERALGDRSEQVRERAAWAVGTLEPETAPVALYRDLLADPSERVRRVAAWALSQIGDARATDALIARLDRESDEVVLQLLSRSLLLATPPSSEGVARLLRSSNPDIRAWAVATAGGAGTPVFPWPWPWPDPRPIP